jgi:hypothetical protein
MSYNPGNQFIGPQVMERMLFSQIDEKKQRKENDALVKGFMQMHQSSPELQRLLPVQDWGNVAPNQIKGWLQGLEMQQGERQQAQQQQAEQQARQQQAREQQALMQVLQGVGPQQRTPAAQYLQLTGGQGMDSTQLMKALEGLQPPPAPTGHDLDGDGKVDVYFGPTGNQVNLETADTGSRARKELESLMTRSFAGSMMQSNTRLHDYITNTYDANGALVPGARPSPIGEELLRQANELSLQTSGKPLFVTRPGAAPVAVAEPDDGGMLGKAARAMRSGSGNGSETMKTAPNGIALGMDRFMRAPAKPPVVAAGPGQTVVAPVDPLVQQAQAFIQQQESGGVQEFDTLEEAEAAAARGYRGPAMINGRRTVIE